MGDLLVKPEGSQEVGCIFILFPSGKRPDRAAVIKALSGSDRFAVTHDPGANTAFESREDAWLELLVDGLTFDLLGLKPGPALEAPPLRHRFGFPAGRDSNDFEAIGLVPGPHLAAASNALPVVRGMMQLAAGLASLLESVEAVLWGPSASAMGQGYFVELVAQWLGGGAFPALGLAGIVPTATGELRSDGLFFFTGQEVEISTELAANRLEGSRLAVRAIDFLAEHGRLEELYETSGIDGTPIVLEPSGDGKLVKVREK